MFKIYKLIKEYNTKLRDRDGYDIWDTENLGCYSSEVFAKKAKKLYLKWNPYVKPEHLTIEPVEVEEDD